MIHKSVIWRVICLFAVDVCYMKFFGNFVGKHLSYMKSIWNPVICCTNRTILQQLHLRKFAQPMICINDLCCLTRSWQNLFHFGNNSVDKTQKTDTAVQLTFHPTNRIITRKHTNVYTVASIAFDNLDLDLWPFDFQVNAERLPYVDSTWLFLLQRRNTDRPTHKVRDATDHHNNGIMMNLFARKQLYTASTMIDDRRTSECSS